VHQLTVDPKAFEALDAGNLALRYADPSRSAEGALGGGVAVGWHLNGTVKLFASYELIRFTGGAGTAATPSTAPVVIDRDDEKVLSFSVNVAY
jgi:hypothetical protein